MDYGELKAAVKSYLYDRTDLVTIIPTFIELAERRLFRVLRCPANEKIVTWLDHDSASVTIPTDWIEAKIVTAGGAPLKRISDIKYLNNLEASVAAGAPKSFCRIGAELHLYPTPDNPVNISAVYWADLSGQLSADSDTHEVLRIAPDAYLHGALIEASRYLGQDSRIPVWAQQYAQALTEIQSQTDEAEYAGSVVNVSGVYADSSRI